MVLRLEHERAPESREGGGALSTQITGSCPPFIQNGFPGFLHTPAMPTPTALQSPLKPSEGSLGAVPSSGISSYLSRVPWGRLIACL